MYGKFLQTNGLNHPGRDETQSKWPTDLADIADAEASSNLARFDGVHASGIYRDLTRTSRITQVVTA